MKKIILLVAILFAFNPVNAQAANLIKNSSFEGNTNSWHNDGMIGFYRAATKADRKIRGIMSVDFMSSGSLYQNVNTEIGKKYKITFDLSGNPYYQNTIDNKKYLQVTLGDLSDGSTTKIRDYDFTFDTTGKQSDNMGWVSESIVFIANSNNTRLTFKSLNSEKISNPDIAYYGALIDNVTMDKINDPNIPVTPTNTPTPEPSTLILGLLGASGLLKFRKK